MKWNKKANFGLGAAILVVLMLLFGVAGGDQTKALGGPSAAAVPGIGNGMIAMSQLAPDNRSQIVTVVDPVNRSMATYRVDLASGKIALCSVRNLHWDLQMSDFNGTNPSSKEVQTMSEQR